MIVHALEVKGIPAVQAGGQAASGMPDLAGEAVDIWVAVAQVEEARAIVHQLQGTGDSPVPMVRWTCPGCGELNAGSFDLCWTCQSPRPE